MKSLYQNLNRAIEFLLILIFSLLVLDVLWQVFGRYVLNQSFSFTEEFARFALIWLTILGAAYLNGRREHLSMDYWLNKLSPADRAKRLKLIELLMFVFAFIVMVIGGGNLVYTTLRLGQLSAAMNVPLGFVYAIVPVSGLLIMFFSIYNYRRHEY
ncbi:TRAP transporter small permease [Neolewinella aurantiaca]|uniref:TRAP transporter small permease n=1 Tax=Neolewinella aurantiaca TaxID=2602767 RepID=A0A5C7FUJ4_9BACT|nr:TRAP transporter small permease [Neolewinella aurantiaca]TXF90257.1 TRAP transporter small permease [Neolewinella aurantiaca]